MIETMVAKHANWPKFEDPIFDISEKAQKAIKKLGKEKVINATIGSLTDDDGNIVTLNTVFDEYKSLPNSEIATYASIAGQKDYLEAVKKACFKDYMPNAYIRAVASPGGSGAIKLAVWNYTNEGDEILTSDWFWSPYVSISEEAGRKITTYQLFDENNNFNFNSFKEKFLDIASKQERIFTILNTPAHNPTGYSIEDNDWDKILNLSKEVSKNPDKKIILFVDIAYIDFVKEEDDCRRFFEKFTNLPENILIIVGFSMSKGFTAYGMRMGAAICITSSKEVAEQFYYSCVHSCRANWSNCNRAPMKVLTNIINNPEKYKKFIDEKNIYKNMLTKRANAFVKSSTKCGLDILPYIDGFFISIPCENPKIVSEELIKENVFVVPLKKGLRFALCAVSEEKCEASPKIIKNVLESVRGQMLTKG